MTSLKNLLSINNYLVINKMLIQHIGLNTAIVLTELLNNNKKINFLIDLDTISISTTLSISKIKNAINKLYKLNFINAEVKKHNAISITILHVNINNYLIHITSESYKDLKNKKKKNPIKIKRFKKPSLSELKKYFLELDSIDESAIMFDYYESKGWKVGKTPMKCWKSATRNWIRRAGNNSGFPDFYDPKFILKIGADNEKLNQYHNHLKKLGWTSIYSPASGTTWKQIKKKL